MIRADLCEQGIDMHAPVAEVLAVENHRQMECPVDIVVRSPVPPAFRALGRAGREKFPFFREMWNISFILI